MLDELALFEGERHWGLSSPILNRQKRALKQLLRIQIFEFKLTWLAGALNSSRALEIGPPEKTKQRGSNARDACREPA